MVGATPGLVDCISMACAIIRWIAAIKLSADYSLPKWPVYKLVLPLSMAMRLLNRKNSVQSTVLSSDALYNKTMKQTSFFLLGDDCEEMYRCIRDRGDLAFFERMWRGCGLPIQPRICPTRLLSLMQRNIFSSDFGRCI